MGKKGVSNELQVHSLVLVLCSTCIHTVGINCIYMSSYMAVIQSTYSKEVNPAVFHEPRLVRHVLEIFRVVEKLFLFVEENLAQFDGKPSTLLQLGEDYPAGQEEGQKGERHLCYLDTPTCTCSYRLLHRIRTHSCCIPTEVSFITCITSITVQSSHECRRECTHCSLPQPIPP